MDIFDLRKALDTDSGSVLIPQKLDPMLVELADKATPLRKLFKKIPWSTNSYVWNERSALGAAAFYNEDSTFDGKKGTYGQKSAPIKMLKQDGGVSNLLILTSKDYINSLQSEIEGAVKSVSQKEEEAYITGDSSVDADSYDGLAKLITQTRNINASITFEALDKMAQDVVDGGGKPGLYILASRDLTELTRIARALGQIGLPTVQLKDLGITLESHNGVPIVTSPFVPANLGYGATNSDGYSYAFCLDLDYIKVPTVLDVSYEKLQATTDAISFRVKEYLTLAVKAASKKHVKAINIATP